MKTIKYLVLFVTFSLFAVSCTGGSSDAGDVVGKWMTDSDPEFITTFKSDNTYVDSDGGAGKWEYDDGFLTISNSDVPFPIVFTVTSLTESFMSLELMGQEESYTKVGHESSLNDRIIGKWKYNGYWYDGEFDRDDEESGCIFKSNGVLLEFEEDGEYDDGMRWEIVGHNVVMTCDDFEDEVKVPINFLNDKKLRLGLDDDCEEYIKIR